MLLVDSSVWIDYFNGKPTAQTDTLDDFLGKELITGGDLMLATAYTSPQNDAGRFLWGLVV